MHCLLVLRTSATFPTASLLHESCFYIISSEKPRMLEKIQRTICKYFTVAQMTNYLGHSALVLELFVLQADCNVLYTPQHGHFLDQNRCLVWERCQMCVRGLVVYNPSILHSSYPPPSHAVLVKNRNMCRCKALHILTVSCVENLKANTI